ncbi:MAG: DUF982 domain-containing protein [Brucella sp.]
MMIFPYRRDVIVVVKYHCGLFCGGSVSMKRDTSKQLEPIFLIFTKHDGRKVIRTARDAARVLMKDWPCDDGEEFYDAVKTCLKHVAVNRIRDSRLA